MDLLQMQRELRTKFGGWDGGDGEISRMKTMKCKIPTVTMHNLVPKHKLRLTTSRIMKSWGGELEGEGRKQGDFENKQTVLCIFTNPPR